MLIELSAHEFKESQIKIIMMLIDKFKEENTKLFYVKSPTNFNEVLRRNIKTNELDFNRPESIFTIKTKNYQNKFTQSELDDIHYNYPELNVERLKIPITEYDSRN